jgi:glycosyltransferase involved in cell wall biosynthesis
MAGLAAIQYAVDTFDQRRAKVMGRQVASQTFLQAWVRHSGADPLTGWVDRQSDSAAFERHVADLGATTAGRAATFADIAPLKAAGALWLGDPGIARRSWYRRWYDQKAWSLVGITHTIASHAAMEQIVDLVRAPVQPWDALICTSRPARDAVRAMVEAEAYYLAERTGARRFPLPELPVIPLGVDCASFRYGEATRTRWRARLGLGPDDVAVLQFGRLAVHAKAHPVPLYMALKEASNRLQRPLHIIFAGQFPNAGQQDDYHQIAQQIGPSVISHFVDGASPDASEVRAAADIGALLSDNIQETFGLAPVELMAAGLPVVGSDWDGLRDTIDHGVTGFRAATVVPPVGVGEYLAFRYGKLDSYDAYLGGVAQSVAVDIGQAADAFVSLARNADRRRSMGDAARRRALERYDWPVIINCYRELLAQLEALRRGDIPEVAPKGAAGGVADPANMDPFRAFASFATEALSADTLLVISADPPHDVSAVLGGPLITRLHGPALPTMEDMETLRAALSDKPLSALSLCQMIPGTQPSHAMAGIAWLLKFGFARIMPEPH